MHGVSREINDAIDREDWSFARRILLEKLKKEPNDHWLLSRLGSVYYEQRKYRKALEYSKKALALAPDCPLVLWDLAGPLFATGKVRAAWQIYRGLLNKGPEKIAKGPCGEGLSWANSLMVDCIFSIGLCLQRMGKTDQAALFFGKFLELRAMWDGGIYGFEDALDALGKFEKANGKPSSKKSMQQKFAAVRELLAV